MPQDTRQGREARTRTTTVATLVAVILLSSPPAIAAINCSGLMPTPPQNTDTNFIGKFDASIDSVFKKLADPKASVEGNYRSVASSVLQQFPNGNTTYFWERILYVQCQAIADATDMTSTQKFDKMSELYKAATTPPPTISTDQKNTNSGNCVIQAQAGATVYINAAPCSPGNANPESPANVNPVRNSDISFVLREFTIDPYQRKVYASLSITNRSADPTILQISSRSSSLELSNPPASVSINQVQGLGYCAYSVDYCIEHPTDVNFTQISNATTTFRVMGNVQIRNNMISTNGTLGLTFVKKVGLRYERLDVSFTDVKLTESR